MANESEWVFTAGTIEDTDFMRYINRLNSESDLGAVLISASLMDELLRRTLLAHLVEVPESKNLIEGGNAPLGTFSSRILAAYCHGLIDKTEFDECNRLRRIRNEFAHDMDTTFSMKRIKDLCGNLHYSAKDHKNKAGEPVTFDTRTQFTTSAVGIIARLHNRADHVAENRLTPLRTY